MQMGCRFCYRSIALLSLAGGILLLDAHASEFVGPPNPVESERADPFPIRRVLLPKGHTAAEFKGVKHGIWLRLAREEFETLVRAASRGSRQRTAAPRLIEARYRAKLLLDTLDENAIEGTAEWKVANGGQGPGILPLDSLRIALTQARWTDNRNAVLGLIEPRSPPGFGLLVEEPGEHLLALEWSCRGVSAPGELRFDLAVPSSPISSLELELPSSVVPVLPQDEALIEGPYPNEDDPRRQNWRIAFGGLSHLEISLRTAKETELRSPLLTSLSSRYDLSPGAVNSQFTFEYQAVRGDVSVLIVETDGDLTATDVNILNLESWRSLPVGASGKKRLEIRLREPARGGQLRIAARSLLPLNDPASWTAPSMNVVGAVTRSETLRIRVPSELKIVDQRPGAFRLIRVEQVVGASILVLEPGLVQDDQSLAVRPSARFLLSGTDYRARQNIIWDVAADRSTLVSRFDFDVQRGAINQLQFRLPNGAEVEKVEFEPKELNPGWTIQPGPNPILQVELARSLQSGSEGRLSMQLRLPGTGAGPFQKTLPFPDVTPLGARRRGGEFRLRVDSALEAFAPPSVGDEGLSGPALPEVGSGNSAWVYRFNGQPPAGPLSLIARLPRLVASVEHTLSLHGGRLHATARLSLQPESSVVDSLVVFASEPLPRSWSWRTLQGTNQVLSVQPLHMGDITALVGAIGARRPLESAIRLSHAPQGQWWRITFARPLTGPLLIESSYEGVGVAFSAAQGKRIHRVMADASQSPLARAISVIGVLAQPSDRRIAAPLLRVHNSSRQQGTVKVLLPSGAGTIETGPALIPTGERRDQFATESTFRIVEGRVFLVIDPSRRQVDTSPAEVDSARLISVVDVSNQRQRCWLAFRVRGVQSGNLPVGLMAGSEVQAVAVAGRTLRSEQVTVEEGNSGTICSVAMPGDDRWYSVEILYTIPARNWWLTTSLAAFVPQLPAQPTALRIEWRLPPEVAPISPRNWVQLPGGSAHRPIWHSPRLSALLEQAAPTFRERGDGVGRIMPNPKGVLPKTVQQALFGSGTAGEKPLIDTLGLAEAGVHESSPAPAGGWESLGLTLVGFPGGTVMTTPRQLSIWTANGAGLIPPSLQQALHEAIRAGRDSSGRFRTVADWVESLPSNEATVLLSRLGGDEPGWTSWEIRDPDAAVQLAVVDTRKVNVIGWLAATVLAAFGIALVGRLGKRGIFLLLSWLLIAGAALQWLPSALNGLAVGPMLSGLFIAFVTVCRRPRRKMAEAPTELIPPSTRRRISIAAVGGSTLVLFLALTATAAAPEEPIVYLLPGSADDPEPKNVLAPSELVDRLKQLAHPRLPVSEYAFLQGNWIGRGGPGFAEFEAHLVVFSFVERTLVELPLGDTRLREALVDGAAAFPRPTGAGRLSFEIQGRGEHRIDLKFATTIGGTGSDREVRFGVPEAAITQVVFHVPTGGQQPRAVNWQGAQRIAEDGKELRADLGRVKSIHLRWRQAGANVKALVRTQEASLWDLNGATGTLYASVDYRVGQGSLQTLRIALPPNVEISRLEVRPESGVAALAPTWVRDWSVTPNQVLSVELQSALTGSFQLSIEAVAVRPLSNRPALQFPSALDVVESETFVALRLRGLDSLPDLERRGVTDFSADSFLKDIWRPAGAEPTPTSVTRAYRRAKNESAFLRPSLRNAPHSSQGVQEQVWRLGPRGAELRGTIRWTASSEPLSFVEWEVATALTVHDVRGMNVHSWQRTGNRVQVWLREPAMEATVVWNSVLPRGGPATETMIFDLPPVRLEGVRTANTLVRVRASEGWALSAENPANLGGPVPSLMDREIAFQMTKSSPARFVLRGSQADALIRIVTVVEVVDRRLRINTHIEPHLRQDRSHSLVLTLADIAGWEASVRGPNNVAELSSSRANGREWVIDLPKQDTQRAPILATLSRALNAVQEVTLPVLTISQGDRPVRIDRWIALLGPEIRGQASADFQRATASPESVLAQQPREWSVWRERGGSIWREVSPHAQIQILASPGALSIAPNVRLGLLDVEAAQSGDQWTCRAAVDLVHEAGAMLECTLPSDGSLTGFALDGEVRSLSSGINRFAVPLPFEPGHRLLQIVWTSRGQTWEPPHFVNSGRRLPCDSVLWTAIALPGNRIDVTTSESMTLHDLKRADALLRLASDREAVGWSDESLQKMSSRIVRWTRLADSAIAGPRSEVFTAERGPNGIGLNDWGARLRDQAQTLRVGRPALAGAPIREATFEKLPHAREFRGGIPVRWSVSAQAAPPEIQIQPASPWTPLPAVASFGLLAIVVVTMGVFMLLLSRSTRPEQAAVLGVLGAVAFGPPEGLLFLSLTAVALLVRTVWFGTRLYRWLGG